MGIFEYNQDELLGTVESVDTSTAIIKVENDDKLRGLQVNHLVTIQSSRANPENRVKSPPHCTAVV